MGYQIRSDQSLSRVQLFATPYTLLVKYITGDSTALPGNTSQCFTNLKVREFSLWPRLSAFECIAITYTFWKSQSPFEKA